MWLLPFFDVVSRTAARVFYRLTVSGARVPESGPVLIVANHPNSLLDPVLVVAAAGRPVRFLAKATLFPDPKVGWLVRGAGSIPVYRREDDPGQMGRNMDTFRAVYDALGEGAAVGIFPEGISHSFPALAELKTGAARIALGAVPQTGGAFPIVPVGIVADKKDQYRSPLLVTVGRAIEWGDLAEADRTDRVVVRELTQRIEAGLRRVTVNLDRWEDRPVVDAAERIWTHWAGADPGPDARVARLEVTTRILSEVRRGGGEEAGRLFDDLSEHVGRLGQLGLTVDDIASEEDIRRRWSRSIVRVYGLGLAAAVPYALAFVVFVVPYQLTDILTRAMKQPEDRVATYKLLIGILAYGFWIVGLAALAGWVWGWPWALGLLVLLPPLGHWAATLRERWRGAGSEAVRFGRLRHLRTWLKELRADQHELAGRLDELQRRYENAEG